MLGAAHGALPDPAAAIYRVADSLTSGENR
jgi:hypothetical protein